MKKCPICESSLKPEITICPQCGWELKVFISMSPDDEIQYKAQLEKARQAWQVRQNTPDLKRDTFEKKDEFKQRLEQNGPYLAGTATLFKQKYNVDNGIFPIEIKWQDWVSPLNPLSNWLYIKAEPDVARKLSEGHSSVPIYMELFVSGEQVSVRNILLSGIEHTFGIKQSSSQQAWEQKREDNWVFQYDLKPNETEESQYKAKPLSDFERGFFETKTEFKQRIENNAYIAGVATLIKNSYDVDNGIFPVKIKWNSNIKLFTSMSEGWFINAERDLAKSVYENSPTHPVMVRFTVEGNEIKVSSLALSGIEQFFMLRHTLDEQAWKKAQQQNTSKSYQDYLDGKTLKKYATEARQKAEERARKAEKRARDKQAWEKAQQLNTSKSYQDYLNGNTLKRYATEARQKKESALATEEKAKGAEKAKDEQAWKTAQQRNTSLYYQAYLNGNTLKIYATEARKKRDYQKKLEEEQAKENLKYGIKVVIFLQIVAVTFRAVLVFPDYLAITIIGSSLLSFIMVLTLLKHIDAVSEIIVLFLLLSIIIVAIRVFLL